MTSINILPSYLGLEGTRKGNQNQPDESRKVKVVFASPEKFTIVGQIHLKSPKGSKRYDFLTRTSLVFLFTEQGHYQLVQDYFH